MKKRPTRKLELEVYEDQIQQFLMALLELKTFDKISKEKAKVLLDAVHFDTEEMAKGMMLTEEEQSRLKEWVRNIHEFLLKASKDQAGYKLVAGNSFEEFERSEFIKELDGIFNMFLFHRKMMGKNGTLDVKMLAALIGTFLTKVFEGLGTAIASGLNNALQVSMAMREPYTISITDGGHVQLNQGGETIALELFALVNGKIVKGEEIPEGFDQSSIEAIYYSGEDNTLVRQITKEDHIEVTTFINVKFVNGIPDLSEAEEKVTMRAPKEINNNIVQLDENTFAYTPQEHQPSTVEEPSQPESISEETEGESFEGPSGLANVFEDYLNNALKFDGTKRGEVEHRDQMILTVTNALQKHYPELTNHVRDTITGYICAQMRLLDREDKYLDTDSRTTYKKYLRNTVSHALKRINKS